MPSLLSTKFWMLTLYPVLGSPVPENHGSVLADPDPEMGHKDAQRAGAPLL